MVLKLKKSFKLVFSFVIAVVLSFGLLACGNDKKGNVLDMNVVYSDITNSVKLTLNYEGKHFINDGIGKAELRSVADGDTASFILEDGTNFRVRFYGIDTNESTGQVEKWGKAASVFTTNALENASEIVLESSTGKKAEPDSYGERYLGYVWYRNSATDEFKNLNLQLVENGYSPNNCTNTIAYKYYSYFEAAENFAEKGKLRIWGYATDVLFSDEAIPTDLKELNENIYAYFNEETEVGSKVSLKATVIDLEIGNGGTHLWTIAQIIDGVLYTFKVYTGYSNAPTSGYLKVGDEFELVGFVQDHYGKWQITGLVYLKGEKGEGYTYCTISKAAMMLDDSVEYSSKYSKNLKASATVTEVTREENEVSLTVTTQTKNKYGLDTTVETYTIKFGVESSYDETQLLNKKMTGVVFLSEDGKYYYTPNVNNLTFE